MGRDRADREPAAAIWRRSIAITLATIGCVPIRGSSTTCAAGWRRSFTAPVAVTRCGFRKACNGPIITGRFISIVFGRRELGPRTHYLDPAQARLADIGRLSCCAAPARSNDSSMPDSRASPRYWSPIRRIHFRCSDDERADRSAGIVARVAVGGGVGHAVDRPGVHLRVGAAPVGMVRDRSVPPARD